MASREAARSKWKLIQSYRRMLKNWTFRQGVPQLFTELSSEESFVTDLHKAIQVYRYGSRYVAKSDCLEKYQRKKIDWFYEQAKLEWLLKRKVITMDGLTLYVGEHTTERSEAWTYLVKTGNVRVGRYLAISANRLDVVDHTQCEYYRVKCVCIPNFVVCDSAPLETAMAYFAIQQEMKLKVARKHFSVAQKTIERMIRDKVMRAIQK